MNVAKIIDGKALAAALRESLAKRVETLRVAHGVIPGLAVILVGDDPASAVYIRNKRKATQSTGMRDEIHHFPTMATQNTIIKSIQKLNSDPSVHGILVQLPLPPQFDRAAIINMITPNKDVDGLHVVNAGQLVHGGKGLIPCTPLGCLLLLQHDLGELSGRDVVILGRSILVGKPLAQLLLAEHATVTLAHSRTRNLAALCCRASILVVAVGCPEMIRGSWIRPGATVIDVGINRIEVDGKMQLTGDVHFSEASTVAGAITPVPGGVGPMTIACLLHNTLKAACRQNNVTVSDH